MEALAENATNRNSSNVRKNAKTINSPLTLPCGAILPNRLAKSAMSELLADSRQQATVAHQTLYRTFARNGPGLLVTGNVQVDRLHLEHAGNVVIHGPQDAAHMASLRAWSAVAKREGAQIWMQLSHGGRQSQPIVNPTRGTEVGGLRVGGEGLGGVGSAGEDDAGFVVGRGGFGDEDDGVEADAVAHGDHDGATAIVGEVCGDVDGDGGF